MKFTVSEVVRGFSNMSYDINGETALVKGVYIDVALNAEHGGRGNRTDFKPVEKPETLDPLKLEDFPIVCELDFEERATRGKVQLVCVGVRAKAKQPSQKLAA